MKETLTKENFWNEMKQKYPKAMDHFKKWINQYKFEHDWDDLFNGGWEREAYGGIDRTEAPKYHELPIAMQFGIFLEYVSNTANKRKGKGMDLKASIKMTGNYLKEIKHKISSWFELMEDKL